MGLTSIIVESLANNTTTVLVFLVIFALLWKYLQPSPYKFPPMIPGKLPLIGDLTFFTAKSLGEHEFWEASKAMNSPIITSYLGSMPVLILHSYEDVTECFSSEDFLGRFNDILDNKLFNGLLNDGPCWKEQRRFALHALRDLGLGKNRMQCQIQEECRHIIEILEEYDGKPTDPTILTNTASSNIICSMVLGHRFDYNDTTYKRMMNLMHENFSKNMRKAVFGSMIPGAKYLPGDPFSMKKLIGNMEEIKATILQPEYEEHLKSYDPNNIGDFIHAFIHEQKLHENSTEEHWFNNQQLMCNIEDLFQAGTETTSTTLRWAFLCMIHYPEVQRKVRAEVLDVIGPDRLPSMHDKKLLSYTEATINEIQRMCLITPLGGPPHMTEHITEFKGYILPAGTGAFANVYAIHHDPKHWDEPFKFKPERFIGPDGNFQKDDHVIPFSVGKHSCLGEGLARMELFLIFVSILQKFSILLQPGSPLPPMEGNRGLTVAPLPYEVCFVRE